MKYFVIILVISAAYILVDALFLQVQDGRQDYSIMERFKKAARSIHYTFGLLALCVLAILIARVIVHLVKTW
jgi:hypothetical protein